MIVDALGPTAKLAAYHARGPFDRVLRTPEFEKTNGHLAARRVLRANEILAQRAVHWTPMRPCVLKGPAYKKVAPFFATDHHVYWPIGKNKVGLWNLLHLEYGRRDIPAHMPAGGESTGNWLLVDHLICELQKLPGGTESAPKMRAVLWDMFHLSALKPTVIDTPDSAKSMFLSDLSDGPDFVTLHGSVPSFTISTVRDGRFTHTVFAAPSGETLHEVRLAHKGLVLARTKHHFYVWPNKQLAVGARALLLPQPFTQIKSAQLDTTRRYLLAHLHSTPSDSPAGAKPQSAGLALWDLAADDLERSVAVTSAAGEGLKTCFVRTNTDTAPFRTRRVIVGMLNNDENRVWIPSIRPQPFRLSYTQIESPSRYAAADDLYREGYFTSNTGGAAQLITTGYGRTLDFDFARIWHVDASGAHTQNVREILEPAILGRRGALERFVFAADGIHYWRKKIVESDANWRRPRRAYAHLTLCGPHPLGGTRLEHTQVYANAELSPDRRLIMQQQEAKWGRQTYHLWDVSGETTPL
jgi:hypothetical protein